MGKDRNWANQENKILKSLSYRKRTKNKLKTEKLEIFGNFLKNKKKKKKEKIKEYDERLIKDKIITDIRTLFEQQEEDHYKPKWVSNFWNKIILNVSVMVIKTATYYQTNILTKLSLTWGI